MSPRLLSYLAPALAGADGKDELGAFRGGCAIPNRPVSVPTRRAACGRQVPCSFLAVWPGGWQSGVPAWQASLWPRFLAISCCDTYIVICIEVIEASQKHIEASSALGLYGRGLWELQKARGHGFEARCAEARSYLSACGMCLAHVGAFQQAKVLVEGGLRRALHRKPACWGRGGGFALEAGPLPLVRRRGGRCPRMMPWRADWRGASGPGVWCQI